MESGCEVPLSQWVHMSTQSRGKSLPDFCTENCPATDSCGCNEEVCKTSALC